MSRIPEAEIDNVIDSLLADYSGGRVIDRTDGQARPSQAEIVSILDALRELLFAGYYAERDSGISPRRRIAALMDKTARRLEAQIALALPFRPCWRFGESAADAAADITLRFLKELPSIRAALELDLDAGFDGDPAAAFREEILLCYPGFYAITVNRLAHALYRLRVPLIPRMMTEHAHSLTGIDIHPGATIGKRFFIDHGTGVVIGETTHIGDNVKLYQGVTLGALSTRGGQTLRGTRRHPTIEDNVTIYAGASILGGNTVIGHGSVIGSNAFITKSIEPESRVSIRNREAEQRNTQDPGTDNSWFYVI